MEEKKKPIPTIPVKPLGGSGRVVKNPEDMTNEEYFNYRGYTKNGMKRKGD